LNLGVNWIKAGWTDTTEWKTLKGQVNGADNLITGTSAPFDLVMFNPLPGSPILNASQAMLPAVSSFPVDKQYTATGVVSRVLNGALDLGAVEY
jgi:hypothetical protein